jgi:hypothetical protein
MSEESTAFAGTAGKFMNTGTKNLSGREPGGSGKNGRLFRGPRQAGRSVPREAGMTMVGFVILAVFVGLFAFAAIRLTPVYLNYMKVAGVLNGVYDEYDGQNPSRAAIRTSISRRFGVESVSVVSHRDIKVTPDSGGFLVVAKYDHTTPFIGNLYFTVRFDKQVMVRR